MATPRVVIIGAGIVGCGLADELSVRGYTDITVVDQGPLFTTGGSSSHAPGLVFQTNSAKVMTDFAAYTVAKYRALSSDGRPCLDAVGGLELATTPERLAELHRRLGWAHAWGLADAQVISPEECAKLHPLVEADHVLGGLYVPSDGLAAPVGAAKAQAEAATARGARFLGETMVTDILTTGSRVRGVATDRGELPADIVVCCAGMWGPRITRMVGMTLPLTPLGHQYATTAPVPALAGQRAEAPHPILRHQGEDLYYREHRDAIGIGYYGHRPMPIDPDDIATTTGPDGMPSMLAFTPDDFTPAWEHSVELLPALADTEIAHGFNGLFSFTPDNMPLIGESPEVAGFWVAEAVWITHSAGVARATAELLTAGVSEFDLHGCDINRLVAPQLTPAYLTARDCQNFVEVYDAIHPLQPALTPPPPRHSPFYPRQLELGAVFGEASGWQRPQWYEANAGLVAGLDIPQPNEWAARHWSPIVGAEALLTRERVALFDMCSLTRLEVSGPGACAFLQWMATGNIDKSVGSVTYCLLLDDRGHVRSDITVTRLGPDRFQIGANGNIDLDWLRRHAPADGSVHVRDITGGTCCVGVWGPHARELVQSLSSDDFSNEGIRYFRAKYASVGTVPVLALRVSYVGELGWELYTSADCGLTLWDTLWDAGQRYGVIAAGRGAFSSMRLEKGYRSFGADMTPEHDPYEAGLGFAVKLDTGDFLGRDAVAARAESAPRRRLTCLAIDDTASVVMGGEPVYEGNRAVGYVTSAAFGYTVGFGIAYAWLPAELAAQDTKVEVGYFTDRVPARVAAEPLFDPDMTRLRG